MAQVYFIGAGPGDPELVTIKARNIIGRADVIIYADSLINPEVCSYARQGVEIHGSASLNLEEITAITVKSVRAGKMVARLQSGDPSLYGAIREQMAALDSEGITYEVVPGVSSLFAAAAALKAELTVPDVTQTVIITRMEGRTGVPEAERLRSLAAHQSTLAVFLSISLVDKVVVELLAGGYPPSTPAAVVYRASWKDEKVLHTTVEKLADAVKTASIKKQALILVGRALEPQIEAHSKLYDKNFKHEYR